MTDPPLPAECEQADVQTTQPGVRRPGDDEDQGVGLDQEPGGHRAAYRFGRRADVTGLVCARCDARGRPAR